MEPDDEPEAPAGGRARQDLRMVAVGAAAWAGAWLGTSGELRA